MGLLDQPLIKDEVQKLKLKKLQDKERRLFLKRMGKPVKKKRTAFEKNMPKKLRKEWGERMNILRSL